MALKTPMPEDLRRAVTNIVSASGGANSALLNAKVVAECAAALAAVDSDRAREIGGIAADLVRDICLGMRDGDAS
jgi:hypothetical protein